MHTAQMVLVTPRQELLAPRPEAPVTRGQPPSRKQVEVAGGEGGDSVAARDEVLALLRDGSGRRPRFDPRLAGGLRAWLEDGAAELVAARGEDAPPLFLGPRLLWGGAVPAPDPAELARPSGDGIDAGDAGSGLDAGTLGAGPYPVEFVRSCLVRALFRQMVTTGRVDDPLTDALDALGVDPGRVGMVRHIEGLSAEGRAGLAASLAAHVAHLEHLTPRFAPGWLPRTNDRIAIPLAGGRVVLCGVFDLLVGAPAPGTATLCALGLTTGGRWAQARTTLHYLALLETLRSGIPPFRVALLHSGVGRYGVEDVLEEHLRTIVSHVVVRLSTAGRGDV
jgi:hypothetical protein